MFIFHEGHNTHHGPVHRAAALDTKAALLGEKSNGCPFPAHLISREEQLEWVFMRNSIYLYLYKYI